MTAPWEFVLEQGWIQRVCEDAEAQGPALAFKNAGRLILAREKVNDLCPGPLESKILQLQVECLTPC